MKPFTVQAKITFFALLITLGSLIACDKSGNDLQPNSISKIKAIIHSTGSAINSENYEYDPSGRVIKISFSDGTYYQYEYRTDSILQKNFHFYKPDTFLLNKEGLVVSEMYGNQKYAYSPDGKVSKSDIYDWNGVLVSTFEFLSMDENATSLQIWESVNGIWMVAKTYHYEFLPNSSNTIGNENMGMAFYGKQDKNLVSVKTLTDHVYNSQEVTKYHYELDAQNRVVKRYTEIPSGDVYEAYTYY